MSILPMNQHTLMIHVMDGLGMNSSNKKSKATYKLIFTMSNSVKETKQSSGRQLLWDETLFFVFDDEEMKKIKYLFIEMHSDIKEKSVAKPEWICKVEMSKICAWLKNANMRRKEIALPLSPCNNISESENLASMDTTEFLSAGAMRIRLGLMWITNSDEQSNISTDKMFFRDAIPLPHKNSVSKSTNSNLNYSNQPTPFSYIREALRDIADPTETNSIPQFTAEKFVKENLGLYPAKLLASTSNYVLTVSSGEEVNRNSGLVHGSLCVLPVDFRAIKYLRSDLNGGFKYDDVLEFIKSCLGVDDDDSNRHVDFNQVDNIDVNDTCIAVLLSLEDEVLALQTMLDPSFDIPPQANDRSEESQLNKVMLTKTAYLQVRVKEFLHLIDKLLENINRNGIDELSACQPPPAPLNDINVTKYESESNGRHLNFAQITDLIARLRGHLRKICDAVYRKVAASRTGVGKYALNAVLLAGELYKQLLSIAQSLKRLGKKMLQIKRRVELKLPFPETEYLSANTQPSCFDERVAENVPFKSTSLAPAPLPANITTTPRCNTSQSDGHETKFHFDSSPQYWLTPSPGLHLTPNNALRSTPVFCGKALWRKIETVRQERTVQYTTIDSDGVAQELCEKEVSETEVLHMESRDTGEFAHRETTTYIHTEIFNNEVVADDKGSEEYVHLKSLEDEFEYVDSTMPASHHKTDYNHNNENFHESGGHHSEDDGHASSPVDQHYVHSESYPEGYDPKTSDCYRSFDPYAYVDEYKDIHLPVDKLGESCDVSECKYFPSDVDEQIRNDNDILSGESILSSESDQAQTEDNKENALATLSLLSDDDGECAHNELGNRPQKLRLDHLFDPSSPPKIQVIDDYISEHPSMNFNQEENSTHHQYAEYSHTHLRSENNDDSSYIRCNIDDIRTSQAADRLINMSSACSLKSEFADID